MELLVKGGSVIFKRQLIPRSSEDLFTEMAGEKDGLEKQLGRHGQCCLHQLATRAGVGDNRWAALPSVFSLLPF